MMATRLPCFSPKCLSFFRQLEKNNAREWFTPRKSVFESEARAPMLELVVWLNERLRKFAVDHVVEPPAKAIYRIYRDTRFSKDKTPYKTHVSAFFPRHGLPKHGAASYYVGISHKSLEIAGGMYMPGPEELKAFRDAIVRDEKSLSKLLADRTLRRLLGDVQGEQSARLPKGYEADPKSPLESLLRRKHLYFYVELDPKVATTPKLANEVIKRFEAMAPVIDHLNQIILAAKKGDEEETIPKRPAPMF
jgi:uncharacterized protein (TIGR02453 family)